MRFKPDNPRRIIVGAHYDSKRDADKDPTDSKGIVPGANDSASGVAVLLESAKIMAQNSGEFQVGVDFVFFDGEEGFPDEGSDIGAWRPIGSEYFARNISTTYAETPPFEAMVIDMVCDRSLGIAQDASSLRHAPSQTKRFWEIGSKIAPDAFLPSNGMEVHDDHTALNAAGIPSFVVIDFDYPAHHTRADTYDKCSADSLATVTKTLLEYLRTAR